MEFKILSSVCFQTNALRDTMYTTHIEAATCFGTQVPSSGSYSNKGVLAILRVFQYIFGFYDRELLLISTCAAY